MSDSELEELLTVTAAAPGNRLARVFSQLLGERRARVALRTAFPSAS